MNINVKLTNILVAVKPPKAEMVTMTSEYQNQELFSREELNDTIKNLSLLKDGAELLASILKGKNLLAKGVKVSVYRKREEHFRQFFKNEDSIVYWVDRFSEAKYL